MTHAAASCCKLVTRLDVSLDAVDWIGALCGPDARLQPASTKPLGSWLQAVTC